MQRDDAVAQIALQLGNRTDLNSAIITTMQLVIETELESNGVLTPWFLLTEDSSTVLPLNERRVEIPTDFLLEAEDWGLGIENEDGEILWLKKDDYDILVERYLNIVGRPQRYALVGKYYYCFPYNPDSAHVLRMRYYAKAPSVVTGNIENAWLKYAPDAVIAYTGFYLADRVLQNSELAAKFNAAKQAALVRLVTHEESRNHTNRRYQMGDD
jgi:hypothetical protein